MSQTVTSVVQGILLGGLYALMAAGLSVAFGVMRIVNVAHGDFIVLGSYLAFVVVDRSGVNPFVTIVIVAPVMFALGYALQRGLLNRTLGGGVLPPLLVTFGLAIILENVLQRVFSADSRGLDAGVLTGSSIRVSDQLAIGLLPLITFAAAVVMLVSLHLLFTRTRLGRAFRAVSDDGETAQLMGIDNRHVYGLAMGLAFATAAVAGVFLALRTSFAPTSGPTQLLVAFEAVIIGGLGSLAGTLLGGVILGVAFTLGEQISPGWGQLAQYLVFLFVLAVRPTGLLAPRTRPA